MSAGKIVLGTVVGVAIGALAGILFAPEKGSTIRRQIIDKGGDNVDKLKSKINEFRDSFGEKVESTKNDAENLAEKGKAKFEGAKKEVKTAAANFKHDGAANKFSFNGQ